MPETHHHAGKRPRKVAIVGGGASGTLVAYHLLKSKPDRPLEVSIFERTGEVGPGVAYREPPETCLLNVRAGNLGADPNDIGGFFHWLRDHGHKVFASAFVPRALYGHYLKDLLNSAERSSPHALLKMDAEVESAHWVNDAKMFELALPGGVRYPAEALVLATGNQSPRVLDRFDDNARAAKGYIGNPFEPGALSRVGNKDRVMIVGTGLTMIDTVLMLRESGHRGDIWALSRRGLLPYAHQDQSKPYSLSSAWEKPATLRGLITRLREEVALGESQGYRAHEVIDALRALTPSLWKSFPEREKHRFLHHVQVHWDVHRHRMAPEVARRIESLRREGALRVLAARLSGAHYKHERFVVDVSFRGGAVENQSFDAVINCTGPNRDITTHPFLGKIAADGLISPDPLRLGIQPLDKSLPLHWLGPLCLGELWETVAMPEIRAQAAAVAKAIVHAG